MSVIRPLPLRRGDKANFATLKRAADDGALALVSAIRKADSKQVALLCAMNYDGEMYCPVPLAVMIEGNPFELFHDPTVE